MEKDLRSDARDNRQQLLEAAAAVFLEHGIAVRLDVVIERAQVGRATFYRNFPDRAALIVALLDVAQSRLSEAAASIPDDENKVFRLFAFIGEMLTVNPVLVDAWRVLGSDSPEITSSQTRFMAVFKDPVSIALAAGTLREDFKLEDVSVVTGMLSAVVREQDPISRERVVARLLELVTTGVSGPSYDAQTVRSDRLDEDTSE